MHGKETMETGARLRGEELEAAATELLREHGAFRRGSGIRSPRGERDASRGTLPWQEWGEQTIREFYGSLCEDLDTLAEALHLTARQKEVLRRCKLEELTFGETARVMGTRIWQVRRLLKEAMRKARSVRHEPPVSARALFWQEIRQKQASIYRRPCKSIGPRFSKKELSKLLGSR